MFAQMQDGLVIALSLSAVVFVLAMFAEGRAYKALYWVLKRMGPAPTRREEAAIADSAAPESLEKPRAQEMPESLAPLPPHRGTRAVWHRAPRHRINVESSPALAHHDTREPEFSSHS